jgi:DNA repair photolyase
VGQVRVGREGFRVIEQRLRGTRYLSHAVGGILNSPESTGIGCWSLNPYVGCEFGCCYCYARFAHRYVVERARDAGRLTSDEIGELRGAHGHEAFERHIFVKDRNAVVRALGNDLRRVLARNVRGERAPMLIGTATDPYQPAERRFCITRAVLERLADAASLDIGIITKSPMVTRDTGLLSRLSGRHRVTVYMSLISAQRSVVRLFEPRSPMPHTRLRALRRLTDGGIHAGLLVAPILPGITDGVTHLRQLLVAAKAHGARFAHPSPLRLYATVRPVFLPAVQRHFPHLVARYLEAYRRAKGVPHSYALALDARFARLAQEAGLPADNRLDKDGLSRRGPQLPLWETPSRLRLSNA